MSASGTVIKDFMIGENRILFRQPKMDDAKDAMGYVNSLIDEKAPIAMQKKVNLSQEKRWLKDLLEKVKKKENVTIVVEVDGRYAGNSSFEKKNEHATSHVCKLGMGIGKEFRNIGIGTELMRTLLGLARDVLGCKIAELSVYDNNEIAKKLYEKMGFVETGRIPDGVNYYGKVADEIIMVRKL